MDYFARMETQFGIRNDVTVSTLSRCPEVLSMEKVPEDEKHMWKLLSETVEEAARRFVDTRVTEG